MRAARAAAWELAWPQHAETREPFPRTKAEGRAIPERVLDIDASIVCYSKKQNATPTWKKYVPAARSFLDEQVITVASIPGDRHPYAEYFSTQAAGPRS
jgi:hypothetical protein